MVGLFGLAEFAGMGVVITIGLLRTGEGNTILTIGLEEMRSAHSSGNLNFTSDTVARSTG